MSDTPVIDSHVHFWEFARIDYWTIRPEMTVLRQDYMPPHLRWGASLRIARRWAKMLWNQSTAIQVTSQKK